MIYAAASSILDSLKIDFPEVLKKNSNTALVWGLASRIPIFIGLCFDIRNGLVFIISGILLLDPTESFAKFILRYYFFRLDLFTFRLGKAQKP